MICIVEQDINKFEASSAAPRPGPDRGNSLLEAKGSPDGILPLDLHWLLVAWSADFANVGPTYDSKRLCESRKEPFPQRGIDKSERKVGSRNSGCLVFLSLLQPPVPSPQTKQQMETDPRSKSVKPVPQERYFQDGNSGNNPNITPKRGVGLHFSGEYMRFFLNKQTYQFTALPFGLDTTPLEFTKVVKEVKLMAQIRGIRIHQYLDNWLLRAPSQEKCLQHTQTLLDLCRELGWVVNMTKSELTPQQVFNFVSYWFDLLTSRVLPTQERWASLHQKLVSRLGRLARSGSSCP